MQPPSHWKTVALVKKEAVARWCASMGSKGVGVTFREGSQKRQKPEHDTSVQSPKAMKDPSGV